MTAPTISSLFTDAAKRLRTEFKTVRSSIPHPLEKGEEVEEILRTFLNDLPP